MRIISSKRFAPVTATPNPRVPGPRGSVVSVIGEMGVDAMTVPRAAKGDLDNNAVGIPTSANYSVSKESCPR
jgi:hypothetical protein